MPVFKGWEAGDSSLYTKEFVMMKVLIGLLAGFTIAVTFFYMAAFVPTGTGPLSKKVPLSGFDSLATLELGVVKTFVAGKHSVACAEDGKGLGKVTLTVPKGKSILLRCRNTGILGDWFPRLVYEYQWIAPVQNTSAQSGTEFSQSQLASGNISKSR